MAFANRNSLQVEERLYMYFFSVTYKQPTFLPKISILTSSPPQKGEGRHRDVTKLT